MFSLSPWEERHVQPDNNFQVFASRASFNSLPSTDKRRSPWLYIALVSRWVGMAFLEKTVGFVERNQSLLGKGVLARFASIYDFIIHIRNANDVSCFLPMFARYQTTSTSKPGSLGWILG